MDNMIAEFEALGEKEDYQEVYYIGTITISVIRM